MLLYGISANRQQFGLQLAQVWLVGMAIGAMRMVIPALSEAEFGVPKNSFVLLSTFVVAFGIVKGVMNFVAGRLSERWGRKAVLLCGWLVALPIAPLVWWAPDWNWIVLATVLLGINQGLTWSMTQTAQLDLTLPTERGLTLGLNEFAGYVGVALAGIATAHLAAHWGARLAVLAFGGGVVALALLLAYAAVSETLPWAQQQAARSSCAQQPSTMPSTWQIFTLMSWRDRRLLALSQAGLVEKFVDALVWVLYPVFLYQRGVGLPQIGWVVGCYGLVWGCAQLFTGKLSDRVGRQRPNVWGMWICGAGVAMMVLHEGLWWWSVAAATSGLGMALLYPNLSAAVADIAPAAWRGSAIGIYRFWRDLGYAVGALGLGIAAQWSGTMEAAFWFVALSMAASGAVLYWLGEESHPRLRPFASVNAP